MNLTCQRISMNFDPKGLNALKGFSAEFAQGLRTAVVGPSGAGKTTLLAVLAGVRTADSGTVNLSSKNICFISQEFDLPNGLTPDQYFDSITKSREDKRYLVEVFHLQSKIHKAIETLSTGQKSRVYLVSKLLARPEWILMDEPFAHLDRPLQRVLEAELNEVMNDWKLSLILVTHQLEQAYEWAHNLVFISDGICRYQGPAKKFYTDPPETLSALFSGPANLIASQILKKHGDYLVIKNSLGEFRLPSKTELYSRDGVKFVYLLIRPEMIRLTDSGIPAQVQQVLFQGATMELTVRTQEGVQLLVKAWSYSTALQVGDKVNIELNKDSFSLLPI